MIRSYFNHPSPLRLLCLSDLQAVADDGDEDIYTKYWKVSQASPVRLQFDPISGAPLESLLNEVDKPAMTFGLRYRTNMVCERVGATLLRQCR
jgi:hypothetical protein